MINSETIIRISSYFTIIAHTPGRLRVRVNPKIANEAQNISLDDITNLPKKISGIEDIKINKIIASVTIIYNPTIFKPKLWEDLIKNENIDEIKEAIILFILISSIPDIFFGRFVISSKDIFCASLAIFGFTLTLNLPGVCAIIVK
jgi:hypothetical protein